MITTPLVTVQEIIDASKLKPTSQLLGQVQTLLDQVDGILWSYVGNRYDLDQFTETNLTGSKALEMLKSITIQGTVGKVLMAAYGAQMLNDGLNANYVYETQIQLMKDIGTGIIRLLDKDNKEFTLVALPNRNVTSNISTFDCRGKVSFSNGDKR